MITFRAIYSISVMFPYSFKEGVYDFCFEVVERKIWLLCVSVEAEVGLFFSIWTVTSALEKLV